MRCILFISILFCCLATRAQVAGNAFHPAGDSNALSQKWSVSQYIGVGAGMGWSPVGNTQYMAVPLGLQVNRRISNNWYAFASAAVAPSFYSFNSSFAGNSFAGQQGWKTGVQPWTPGGRMGLSSRVDLGLMYVNEARTFSVSGSIGVSRGSYPYYPGYYLAAPPNRYHGATP